MPRSKKKTKLALKTSIAQSDQDGSAKATTTQSKKKQRASGKKKQKGADRQIRQAAAAKAASLDRLISSISAMRRCDNPEAFKQHFKFVAFFGYHETAIDLAMLSDAITSCIDAYKDFGYDCELHYYTSLAVCNMVRQLSATPLLARYPKNNAIHMIRAFVSRSNEKAGQDCGDIVCEILSTIRDWPIWNVVCLMDEFEDVTIDDILHIYGPLASPLVNMARDAMQNFPLAQGVQSAGVELLETIIASIYEMERALIRMPSNEVSRPSDLKDEPFFVAKRDIDHAIFIENLNIHLVMKLIVLTMATHPDDDLIQGRGCSLICVIIGLHDVYDTWEKRQTSHACRDAGDQTVLTEQDFITATHDGLNAILSTTRSPKFLDSEFLQEKSVWSLSILVRNTRFLHLLPDVSDNFVVSLLTVLEARPQSRDIQKRGIDCIKYFVMRTAQYAFAQQQKTDHSQQMRKLLQDTNALSATLAAMGNFTDDKDISFVCCSFLGMLSMRSGPSVLTTSIFKTIFDSIFSAMRNHPCHHGVQCSGCLTVTDALSNDKSTFLCPQDDATSNGSPSFDSRAYIVRNGIDCIFASLPHMAAADKRQLETTLRHLLHLIDFIDLPSISMESEFLSTFQNKLARVGGGLFLLDAMNKCRQNEAILCYGCRILNALTSCGGRLERGNNKNLVGDYGCIATLMDDLTTMNLSVIVNAMKKFPDNRGIFQEGGVVMLRVLHHQRTKVDAAMAATFNGID